VVVALLVLVSMGSACDGAAPDPVDHAEHAPPTPDTVPRPSGSTRSREDPEPFIAGTFDEALIGEASGVAASVRNPGWVYVLDDGPGTDGVVAVDTLGGGAVRIIIDGFDVRDTEGLAVGRCGTQRPSDSARQPPDGGTQRPSDGATQPHPDGAERQVRTDERRQRRTCLFIGDIGNNQDLWTTVDIWRLREPTLDGRPHSVTLPAAVTTYAYDRAPVDAEALLVEDGRPFLVTKERMDPASGRAPPPHLLAADRWGGGVLRDLGTIPLPQPTIGLAAAAVGNVVTGGEAGADVVILRTYDHVVAYTPPTPGAGLETLDAWSPREVSGLPELPQAEAVAVDRCGLWLASERVDSLWLAPWSPAVSGEFEEQACPSGDGRS
jgi:hypothetical protein